MDRRFILKAFTAIAASCANSKLCAQPFHSHQGCHLSSAAAQGFSSSVDLLYSSGNSTIDASFPAERSILNSAFLVSPDFSFYDDSGAPNAMATTANLVGSSPYGTVIFGRSLLASELGQTWWGAAVAGISAHEWAHIAQFASGLSGPVYAMELHADYLAGWYLGRKALAGTHVVIAGLGNSLFSKGSFDFNNPDWHGTPQQRVNAMIAGYDGAVVNNTISAAYNAGRIMIGI